MLSSSSTIRIRSATSETLGPAGAALCSGRAIAHSIERRYGAAGKQRLGARIAQSKLAAPPFTSGLPGEPYGHPMRAAALVVLLVAASAMSSCATAAQAARRAASTVPTDRCTIVSTSPPVVATVASDCAGAGTVERVEAPFGAPGARLASVYLPACYAREPQRRFPVVFLLHGAGADASQWPAIGLATTADDLITSGAIPPMIVVMPDGGATMPDGLAADLVDRLVPWADQTYRTLADSADRAVGGISRGGRVALLAVAMHPGVFSGVGGHSPAVGPSDDAIAARLSGRVRSDPPRRRRQGRAQARSRALREPCQDRGRQRRPRRGSRRARSQHTGGRTRPSTCGSTRRC